MKSAVRLWVVIVIVGCGDDATPGTDAGTGTDATVDAAAQDTGVVPADGGRFDAGPACEFVDELEQGCSEDSACVVGLHQIDCCGTTIAVGFHTSAAAEFDTAEGACGATYPACRCAPAPTATDSGETTTDTNGIVAGCIAQGPQMLCLTYIDMRPADLP